MVGERALAFGNAGGFIAGGGVVLCGAEARDARAVGRLQWAVRAAAQRMGDTYLKQHVAPEDIEDYHHHLCGRTMMAKTVLDLLHSLGVEDQDIRFDNFGG